MRKVLFVFLPIVALTGNCLFIYGQQNRTNTKNKPPQPVVDKPSLPKSASQSKVSDDKENRYKTQAVEILEEALISLQDMNDPIAQMLLRIKVADALWTSQPERARQMLTDDYRRISSLKLHQVEAGKPAVYKGMRQEEVQQYLDRLLLLAISVRDDKLAESLLREKFKGDEKKTDRTKGEMLNIARTLADNNPEVTARIITHSLDTGFSTGASFALSALRESSPEPASVIFNKVLASAVKSEDLATLYRLGMHLDAMERHTDHSHPREMQTLEDTKALVRAAAALLTPRVESPQSIETIEQAYLEMFLWRSLQKPFRDLLPDKSWMIDLRLNQISTRLVEIEKSRLQNSSPGQWEGLAMEEAQAMKMKQNQQSDPAERLRQMTTRAENFSGTQRDVRLGMVAVETWKQQSIEAALKVADKISDQALKEVVISALKYKEGSRMLTREGPDKSLEQARAINLPMFRVWLFRTVTRAFRSAGRIDESDAIQQELLSWLESGEQKPEAVAGLFAYLDNNDNQNVEQKFIALASLGRTLSKVGLEPPPNLFPREIFWHPMFHSYEKSLSQLIRADFEKTLEGTRNISDKEARLTLQVAAASEYLRQSDKKTNRKQAQQKSDAIN
jgi:hypothetical protein